MEITTKQILNILYILSWIIFAGLCILAFGFLFSTIYTLTVNPVRLITFWDGADLSDLYNSDRGYFFIMAFLMTITTFMKALMFYLIVKILHQKKLNMAKPFSKEVGSFIFYLSYIAFGIAILSGNALNFTTLLLENGVKMPDLQMMHLGGSDVWLFMSVILFVIAHIFKQGIEIQAENELTI